MKLVYGPESLIREMEDNLAEEAYAAGYSRVRIKGVVYPESNVEPAPDKPVSGNSAPPEIEPRRRGRPKL